MNLLKVIGWFFAAGTAGAISCAASKRATDEIRNKDVDEIPEDDDITIPDDTVEI